MNLQLTFNIIENLNRRLTVFSPKQKSTSTRLENHLNTTKHPLDINKSTRGWLKYYLSTTAAST